MLKHALSNYDARWEFGEHERRVKVARGETEESNSSFLSALQTKCSNTGSDFHETKWIDQILKQKQLKAKVNET